MKGKVDSFTLESLTMKFLKDVRQEKLHDGLYDVQILQRLFYEKIPKDNLLDELLANSKTLSFICNARVKKAKKLKKTTTLSKSFAPMQKAISMGMITRLAGLGIDYQKLQNVFF